MTQRNNILQELLELESTLTKASPLTVYHAPPGYFEGLAEEVMSRIRVMDGQNTGEELVSLSPFLSNTGRSVPYQVPTGYFDGLENKLMQAVLQNEDHQTVQEELENLSPLLSGVKKQVPYSIPANYFDSLSIQNSNKETAKAKVVSMSSHKWFRYAAAAVIIVFVTIGGFLFLNRNESIDQADKSFAWVKKNMKKVSTDELDQFIGMSEEEAPVVASNNTAGEINEVKELMKNIPDEEIQDFLNDAQVAEPDSNNDILLN